MGYDRKFLIWALCYAVAGMVLGIMMAESQNHTQHVTHAHIMLIGFVVSLSYGLIHKLWLGGNAGKLATVQYVVHHAGALTIFPGLYLLYGGIVPEPKIGPLLGVASTTVLVGMVLMLVMVLKHRS